MAKKQRAWEWVKKMWDKVPWYVKKHLASAIKTFIATFMAVMAVQIEGIDVDTMGWGAVSAGIVVAFRFAVKALLEDFTGIFAKKTNTQ